VHVLRPKVAVPHRLAVRVGKRFRDIQGDPKGLIDGKRPLPRESLAKRHPVGSWRGVVERVPGRARIGGREDARMSERGNLLQNAQHLIESGGADDTRVEHVKVDISAATKIASLVSGDDASLVGDASHRVARFERRRRM
jgi:hypothetical protein